MDDSSAHAPRLRQFEDTTLQSCFRNPFQIGNLEVRRSGPIWNPACTIQTFHCLWPGDFLPPLPGRLASAEVSPPQELAYWSNDVPPTNQNQALRKIVSAPRVETVEPIRPWHCRAYPAGKARSGRFSDAILGSSVSTAHFFNSHERPAPVQQASETDPLYLFACHIEWERKEEPSAAWELLSAAQSSNPETRAHARALLTASHHLGGAGLSARPEFNSSRKARNGHGD